MAKWRDRECVDCHRVEWTASTSIRCSVCATALRVVEKQKEEVKHLTSLGYQVLDEPHLVNKHRAYRLLPPCCFREFSPTYANILKQLAHGTELPCRGCGGAKRMAAAHAGYMREHAATYDEALWSDYSKKVRRLSERTYRAHQNVINPLGLKRGRTTGTHHLDHKVSIIWCFKNGIAPEVAAGVNNLQMLTMGENLTKGRKLLSDDEAVAILNTPSVKQLILEQVPGWTGRVVTDLTSVVEGLAVREGEYLRRPEAVVARLRYQQGLVTDKVGARHLKLGPVEPEEERRFLDLWHVQGWSSSRMALGLWRDEHLLAIMTFTVPRYKQKEKRIELLRFCTMGGVVVAGGASKLLAEWTRQNPGVSLVSYSLNRWGSGTLYERLGFKKVSTSASPAYLWPDGKLRSWRASVLKARHDGIDLKALLKVADPGSTTWHLDAQVVPSVDETLTSLS